MRGFRTPLPPEQRATLVDVHDFLRRVNDLAAQGKKATHGTMGCDRREEEARQIARKKGWAVFPAKSGGEKGRGWLLTDAGRAILASLPTTEGEKRVQE